MRKRIIFFIAFSLPFFASAQLTFSVNSGIGTYAMGDLKTLQNNLRANIPVKAQVTASFPAYWFYELTATHELENRNLIGGTFSYGSTGGRLYYSDYSGTLWSDQLASSYSFTTLFGKRASLFHGKFNLQGDIRPGITITKVIYSVGEELIGVSSTAQQYTFHSVNLMIQPTLSLNYKLGPVTINSFAGYNLNFAKSDLTSSDKGVSVLTTANGSTTAATADWSGLRAGAGVAFDLDAKSSLAWEKYSVGLGIGFNYGGIGMNVCLYPQRNVGVFLGAGYALAGFGTNAGVKLRLPNENARMYPYLIGMYGYNTAIVVKNQATLNKIFYGPSFGIGFEHGKSARRALWSFALLVPVRGSEVDSYINALKTGGVQFSNTLPPLAISIGFRFNTGASN